MPPIYILKHMLIYMKNILLLIILVVLNLILFNSKNFKIKTEYITETKTDTIVQVDTVYIEKPILDTVYIDRIIRDTVYSTDSVLVEVLLPIEKKVYQDSTYECHISGYKANVDYLKVYPRTIYVTNEKVSEIKPKRLTQGFQGGVGYGLLNNKLDLWLGYGFQINF